MTNIPTRPKIVLHEHSGEQSVLENGVPPRSLDLLGWVGQAELLHLAAWIREDAFIAAGMQPHSRSQPR